MTGDKEPKRKFKTYPIGYFHIDIAEVQTAEGTPSAPDFDHRDLIPIRSHDFH